MLIVDKKQAGNAILLACKEYDGQDKKYIGDYRGFDLYIQFNSLSQYYIMSLKKELYYPVELGNDVYGNLTRIDNAIENIPKSLKVEKELLQNTLQQLHNAELEVEKPFEKEDELNNALKKLSKINKELDLDKKENIPDTSVQKNDTGVGHKSKVSQISFTQMRRHKNYKSWMCLLICIIMNQVSLLNLEKKNTERQRIPLWLSLMVSGYGFLKEKVE